MADNITYLTCSVGDRIKLLRPLGYPPVTFTSTDGESRSETQYLNGFVIYDPELGEFEGIDDAGYVYYRHKKSGRQTIEYMSKGLGNFKFYLIIQGIVVHDHASIAMGGPAFATYYNEQQREEQ